MTMQKKIIGWVKLALKFSFSFFILWYMVHTGRLDLTEVQKGFRDTPALVGSILLVLFALSLSLYRWGRLMKGLGVEFTNLQLLRYGMIGCFFNTTMPGAVSGDLIKVWYVVADHKGCNKTSVLTSVVMDRIMGVFGLVIVASSPMLLFGHEVWAQPRLRAVAGPMLLLFCGMVAFFLLIMLSSWGPFAKLRTWAQRYEQVKPVHAALRLYDAWSGYQHHPWILAQSLLLSVGTHLSIVTVVALCAHAIGEAQLQPFHYFLLVPVGLLTTAIPIAPAGLGVGQVAFGELFKLAGSANGSAIFTMLVTLQILLNLSGVFFYLRSPNKIPQQELEPAS
jgi:glycosyltransferase 2 family protein